MKALKVTIQTEQPLLIPPSRPGDENSAVSLEYIPGSILRGVFIQHYALQKGQKALDASDPEFRRLFLDDSVRYLNAYPVDHREKRALPTPLSWRMRKDDREKNEFEIYDFAVEWNDDLEQPTSVAQPFCVVSHDEVTFPAMKRVMHYHNVSFRRMRKAKQDSTVFRYEAIAPGEVFVAAVIADDDRDLAHLQKLWDKPAIIHLGKSRRAGYGTVRVSTEIVPDWGEYEAFAKPGNDIIMTLLSDTILRDPETGQWTHDLGKVLGKAVKQRFIAASIVGGVNKKWGLPMLQSPALRAGSVFVFDASAFSDQEQEQLTRYGIGERRAEGFGRVAFGWQTSNMLNARPPIPHPTSPSPVQLSAKSAALARQMLRRMVQEELERRLLDALSVLEIDGNISNAQLSRLRLAIRRAQTEGAWKPMQDFLHEDNLKATARRQLERARVRPTNERLIQWLGKAVLIDQGSGRTTWSIWQDWFARKPFSFQLSNLRADDVITDAMKLEYTLRLIDALLHKKSKGENP